MTAIRGRVALLLLDVAGMFLALARHLDGAGS